MCHLICSWRNTNLKDSEIPQIAETEQTGQRTGEDVKESELSHTAGGKQNGTTTLERRLAIIFKS